MLDATVKAEIEAHLGQYPERQAASVEALHAVQRRYGWISDEHLREVAALLGMSPAELDGVASFYNLLYRRPVGRHVVLVCDSVSCWMMGGDRVSHAIRDRLGGVRLGQVSADGEFTVLPMCCLGACDGAPVVMVGEDTHLRVDPDAVGALLDGYR